MSNLRSDDKLTDQNRELVVRPVHSSVPGRLRLRVGSLKQSNSTKQLLERGLMGLSGVSSATASALTGNLLVTFDRSLGLETISRHIEGLIRGSIVPPELDESGHEAGLSSHFRSAEEIARELDSSLKTGLTPEQAQRRLRTSGRNLIPSQRAPSELAVLLNQFKNPPVALLAVAALVSIATGGVIEALSILFVLGLNGMIGFLTESRAQRMIQNLGLSGQGSARVIRQSLTQTVSVENVVPGDLIVVQRGDVVPADARVVAAHALTVSEAALTGESQPVEKTSATSRQRRLALANRTNMLYRGTIITGGSGRAIVVATGPHTQVGQIQRLVGTARTPETPSQRQLRVLGVQVAWFLLGASGILFGIGWLRGYALLQMARSALSTAVAAIPEGLPVLATSTLAVGVNDMQHRGVLVSRLDALETLAAVQVLCFDKTGTLTFNLMKVTAVDVGDGLIALEEAPEPPPAARRLPRRLRRLYEIAALCNDAEITARGNQTELTGSSTETALLATAQSNGVDVEALRAQYRRVLVRHRTEHYRFMLTAHKKADGRIFLAVKGNPLDLLGRCSFEEGPAGASRALTPRRRLALKAANAAMASQGLRVLGFAYADTGVSDPVAAEAMAGENLTWVGLAGLTDPIRPNVPELMATLRRAGIRTIMLTGDQSATARAVAAELGFGGGESGPEVVDAADIERWPEPQLISAAARADVFARVSPEQKLRIVRALQQSGAVVAMTGDGINDSPALRAADVGIVLGENGTAAAREVADILLESTELDGIIAALERGRATRSNLRRSVHYLLATNSSEVLLMLAGAGAGLGEVLSPSQLLWVNLVTDVVPGIGLALEPPEPDLMAQGPRPADVPIITSQDFRPMAAEASVIGAGALSASLYGALRYGANSAQTRTVSFSSLVTAQLLHAITCRSQSRAGGINPALLGTVMLAGAAQGLALFLPGLRELLGLARLSLADRVISLAAGVAPFVTLEMLRHHSQRQRQQLVELEARTPTTRADPADPVPRALAGEHRPQARSGQSGPLVERPSTPSP